VVKYEAMIQEVIDNDIEYLDALLRQRIRMEFEVKRGVELQDYLVEQLLPVSWYNYVRGN